MALTRQRGNRFGTRQRPLFVGYATPARRTPARGNEKTEFGEYKNPFIPLIRCTIIIRKSRS
jgi:hypothetical protein